MESEWKIERERYLALTAADIEGRVVVLPCNAGGTIWFETWRGGENLGIQPHVVKRIAVSVIVDGPIVDVGLPVEEFGKTIFLSEAAAREALAGPPKGNSILTVEELEDDDGQNHGSADH